MNKDLNQRDKRAKEMACKALRFAMDKGIIFSHAENGFYFYFPKHGFISDHTVYLNWENREDLFFDLMEQAENLTSNQ